MPEQLIIENIGAEKMYAAVLNILEDFAGEKQASEQTQNAVLNILEDFTTEKRLSEDTQNAVLNILEDFTIEKESSEQTQKAMLNILDDFNLEKLKVGKANTELIAANKELESFSYTISHDLRNPLRAVNGFVKMLEFHCGKSLDAEGLRLLGIVEERVLKMGQLIDDLLALARLGRKEIVKTNLNLNNIVKVVLAELNKTVVHKAKINVGVLHHVEADEILMEQVITNLLLNAIKYSSKSTSPEITITSELKDKEVIFVVSDNGVGFDMQYVDKLFGVFERLHDDEEFEGTGVGLAIVDRIIARHGGRVWATGKINEGATFFFSLPATE